jgi:protein-disulfide isomerase
MTKVKILFVLYTLFITINNAIASDKTDHLKINDNDLSFGKRNAKVQIIEYADFGCHHCADFFNDKFPTLYDKYIKTGKVRFAFRPLVISRQSLSMSQILFCEKRTDAEDAALMQLFFKNMHKLNNPNYMEVLERVMIAEKWETKNMYKCVNDKDIKTKIIDMRQVAIKELKIPGVPFIYINGKQMEFGVDIFKEIDNIIK